MHVEKFWTYTAAIHSHIPCDTKFHMKHTYTLTSHSTSSFEEFKIPMMRDLYIFQLYKIYYKNIHHILPVYMFSKDYKDYNNGTVHNHNLRHQALRLPMTIEDNSMCQTQNINSLS